MAKDAKYIPFPLYLISGLPGNLNEIFDYGIGKFAKMVEFSDLITVYRQVLYAYYRGNLPESLLNKINFLAEEEFFIPDEDYNGFTGEGDEFNPATGIDEFSEAGERDEDFRQACIDYWQMQQAMKILNLSGGDIDTMMASAARTQRAIDEWEKKGGRDVTVMMSISMMFQYYQRSKSPYEIDLLRAFLSIKSILGNKELVATTKDYILTRMTGARKKELLPQMLKKPGIKAVYETYTKRYQMDKLLSELLARGFITGKLAYNRRIYLSTHFTTAELPEAVHVLLTKNNTKIKRDRNSAIENDARKKLKALIKAG
ncbi:hypothetical protein [Mucilaginibacter sp.]|uniref:hypothetical protein n=1 Tax=Mucilaginibacter sp. TaxID=1882438 RepID=UPI0035BC2FF7